jgi:hypothetical protein
MPLQILPAAPPPVLPEAKIPEAHRDDLPHNAIPNAVKSSSRGEKSTTGNAGKFLYDLLILP